METTTLSWSKFSWQNVVDGQGLGLTITGILVVFAGLTLIALFVNYLPQVFVLLGRANLVKKQTETERVSTPDQEVEEIAAVIGYVVQMEVQRFLVSGTKKITFDESSRDTAWGSVGKMRTLATRR